MLLSDQHVMNGLEHVMPHVGRVSSNVYSWRIQNWQRKCVSHVLSRSSRVGSVAPFQEFQEFKLVLNSNFGKIDFSHRFQKLFSIGTQSATQTTWFKLFANFLVESLRSSLFPVRLSIIPILADFIKKKTKIDDTHPTRDEWVRTWDAHFRC